MKVKNEQAVRVSESLPKLLDDTNLEFVWSNELASDLLESRTQNTELLKVAESMYKAMGEAHGFLFRNSASAWDVKTIEKDLHDSFRAYEALKARAEIPKIENSIMKDKELLEKAEAQLEDLFAFVKDIANNYDCDSDAHRYGTTCRACDALKLLTKKRITNE